MQQRLLGKTGLTLPWLSYGASYLGRDSQTVDFRDAVRAMRVALDLGIKLIDTSPYYGRGLSEGLIGVALRDVPRDRYVLCTKLGRYDEGHFDFSARRVGESIDVSLRRMGVEYLDIVLCHDVEFADLQQIVDETLPAMRKIQQQGKVRYVGISGYPMHVFRWILDRADLDVALSYNHYTLQNTRLAELVPLFKAKGVGLINAAPFEARLLTNAPLPPWHKSTPEVRALCRRAAEYCATRGVDIAQLALQFSLRETELTTCVVGSANADNVRKWVEWADMPLDRHLLAEVLAILEPIHNWFFVSGRPENNDRS
jgi:aryl-alcohol dehydrogenase-like predicted oxidoreductase